MRSASNWSAELLAAAGYSLQANRKTREGAAHPDRDAQFRYINRQVRRFQAAAQPVISVDTKKKELVGDFKNAGRQWRPKGRPEPVRVHDFLIPEKGKADSLRGLRSRRATTGGSAWASTTTRRASRSGRSGAGGRRWAGPAIRGRGRCSSRRTAVAATGPAVRLWKWELQQLANRTGLAITVCHFPPGTSKWNKIEHRLFSYISTNWRGQPLVSLAVIVNLIGATRTAAGLRVRCELDRGSTRKGKSLRRGDGHTQSRPASLPRRLELHDPSEPANDDDSFTYFLTTPKGASYKKRMGWRR